MQPSKVFFTDMRCYAGMNLQQKLEKLIRKAGIADIDFDNKFTAIKIHFGEPGNLSFLRPNFAKTVVDVVKSLNGLPFLTDCSTLYVGRRKNALEHIDAAYENGYSPFSTGCQVLIADGLKGTDDIEVPIAGGEYCKTAKIGRAIMDADVFIALSHFKGHESTGFGGALKNTGMGCGSRAGKMEMHCSGKPEVDAAKCRGCGQCAKICANNGIVYENHIAKIDLDHCVGCGRCIGACNFDAISNPNDNTFEELNGRIAEYAKAVVDGRPAFYINIVNQVSPYCDCHSENDAAIIPDVGMFASFDPVALDVACADACNAMPVMQGSHLADQMQKNACDHHDHFCNSMPETDWRTCTAHAEKIGMGMQDYELITIR
ncbi:MAG: DUF362 domain-containing protein [Ruthenibacterium sp.]